MINKIKKAFRHKKTFELKPELLKGLDVSELECNKICRRVLGGYSELAQAFDKEVNVLQKDFGKIFESIEQDMHNTQGSGYSLRDNDITMLKDLRKRTAECYISCYAFLGYLGRGTKAAEYKFGVLEDLLGSVNEDGCLNG